MHWQTILTKRPRGKPYQPLTPVRVLLHVCAAFLLFLTGSIVATETLQYSLFALPLGSSVAGIAPWISTKSPPKEREPFTACGPGYTKTGVKHRLLWFLWYTTTSETAEAATAGAPPPLPAKPNLPRVAQHFATRSEIQCATQRLVFERSYKWATYSKHLDYSVRYRDDVGLWSVTVRQTNGERSHEGQLYRSLNTIELEFTKSGKLVRCGGSY